MLAMALITLLCVNVQGSLAAAFCFHCFLFRSSSYSAVPGNILITMMAHALIMGCNQTGSSNERYQTAASRGTFASVKPLTIPAVINDTGHVGALTNTLREIGAVTLGPSVRVVNKGKLVKPRSYIAGDEETNVE